MHHYGSCHQEWNGNFTHRRPQAYIPPTMHGHTFALSHSSPNHTAGPHPHLGGHPHSQPTLLSYPPSGSLVTAAPVAHLLPSPVASRPPVLQPTYNISHPAGIMHQVTVGINPRLLPSPTLHPQGQFKPLFPPHSYIASPAYTSFPLSPTKINQYPYIWVWLPRPHLSHPRAKCRGQLLLYHKHAWFSFPKPWHNQRESKLFFESCKLGCNCTSSFKNSKSSNGEGDWTQLRRK